MFDIHEQRISNKKAMVLIARYESKEIDSESGYFKMYEINLSGRVSIIVTVQQNMKRNYSYMKTFIRKQMTAQQYLQLIMN